MSNPTSANQPDPSAESGSPVPEAPAVSDTDPTGEPTMEPTTESASESASEPTTESASELTSEPTTEFRSEPVTQAMTTSSPAGMSSEPSEQASPVVTDSVVTDSVVTDSTPAPAPIEPKPPTGPHLPAILLGIACLIVAVIAIAQELGRLTIDWGNVGPLGIVAAGAVLVVLGLVSLMASRKS